MITVTYNGESIECTTALKGTDYIHLLDADSQMIAAFEGVSSFTGFSISGGSWTTPTDVDECYLVTIGEDGVLRKGGHKCSEVSSVQVCTISATAPTDTGTLWIDSAHNNVMKYYNGTAWVTSPAVWG